MQEVGGITGHQLNISTGELRLEIDTGSPPSLANLAQAVHEAGFTLLDVEVQK